MWMRRKTEVGSQASEAYFGVAWPEVNDGLTYHDIVRPTDSGRPLFIFYIHKLTQFSNKLLLDLFQN